MSEPSGVPEHIANMSLYDACAALKAPQLVAEIEAYLADLPLHEAVREVKAAIKLYRRLGVPVSIASLANTLETACHDWMADQ